MSREDSAARIHVCVIDTSGAEFGVAPAVLWCVRATELLEQWMFHSGVIVVYCQFISLMNVPGNVIL